MTRMKCTDFVISIFPSNLTLCKIKLEFQKPVFIPFLSSTVTYDAAFFSGQSVRQSNKHSINDSILSVIIIGFK